MPFVEAEKFSGSRDGTPRPRRVRGQRRGQGGARRRQRYTRSSGRWSKALLMGKHLRVHAAEGFRAVVTEVEPGLYLVAETPASQVTEFGVAALAPLAISAATKALQDPQATLEKGKNVVNAGKSIFQSIRNRPRRKGPKNPQPSQQTEIIDIEYEEIEDVQDHDEDVIAGLLPAPGPGHMARWMKPEMAGYVRRCG